MLRQCKQVTSWQLASATGDCKNASPHLRSLMPSPGCLQSYKHEERKLQQQQQLDFLIEKTEKKERSSKTKDKREKISDEEKELRKERKLGRKRDRAEEAMLQAEMKRRREEEKAAKIISHQNGELIESPHSREKHHHSREKSPYARERSHDRIELREKQYPFHRYK